jgi:lysine 6-dehydrogenase
MKYTYLILGAGRQGLAIAYDLAKFGEAKKVVLADNQLTIAKKGIARLKKLIKKDIFKTVRAEAANPKQLAKIFKGADCVISAAPYKFNYSAAKAAIAAGTNFCDLGGNTDIVFQELSLNKQAVKANITVVPDTGLMPGMGNTLAMYAINKLEKPIEVRILCGGLPQKPKPPLNYKLVFSVEGLINEYFGKAYVLRNNKITDIPTFTELEKIKFPKPVGKCEAFVTSGGTSTCPWTLKGKVKNYDYKTVRYPGHYEKIKTLLELGFFDLSPIKINGKKTIPRDLSKFLIARKIDFPKDKDLVVLRITAAGKMHGKKAEIRIDVLDYYDDKKGFSAMERMTGFPAAIIAHHLAQGLAPKGAIPLEKIIEPGRFIKDLKKRGIVVKIKHKIKRR